MQFAPPPHHSHHLHHQHLAASSSTAGLENKLKLSRSRRAIKLQKGSVWQADHITPVVSGGGSCDLSNIRTLCRCCHLEVTKKLSDQRKEEKKRTKAEQKDKEKGKAKEGGSGEEKANGKGEAKPNVGGKRTTEPILSTDLAQDTPPSTAQPNTPVQSPSPSPSPSPARPSPGAMPGGGASGPKRKRRAGFIRRKGV